MHIVELVDPCSDLLDAVKALGNRHKKTLGFFPDGAFDEHAAKGRILVAKTPAGTLAGYLVFRVARECATIVHLCCDESVRGQGYAKSLLTALETHARKQQLCGISLHCRREYDANKLWERTGFTPISHKLGRGQDGAVLTLWRLALQREDLFSGLDLSGGRLIVAIDCNICRDLHDQSEPRNQEALHLAADWLDDQLELVVTSELFVELNRIELPSVREPLQRDAKRYRLLAADQIAVGRLVGELKHLMKESQDSEPSSDIRHIALAIAGKADVLVTRDGEMLERAGEIESRYGLQLRRPVELITELDETEHAVLYQPARFASTEITISRPRPDCVAEIAAEFQSPRLGEKREHLIAALRATLSDALGQKVEVARIEDRLMFLSAAKHGERSSTITLLRAVRSPAAMTALRHRMLSRLAELAKSGGGTLRIGDAMITGEVRQMLTELGFRHRKQELEKTALRFVGRADQAALAIQAHGLTLSPTDVVAESWAQNAELEFWPAKIIGSGIRTWTVPIRTHWATELFDTRFASEQLFNVDARLILNRENVFYSRALTAGLRAPGRIVWYVSDDPDQIGAKSYRACSRLLEVVRGPAKKVFRQFQRLGVYQWHEIKKMTDGDANGEILALRFSDTELFDLPVSFEEGKEMGIAHSNAGPLPLDERLFEKIYRRGMRFEVSD